MKRKLGYLGMIMLCIAALGAAFSYAFQRHAFQRQTSRKHTLQSYDKQENDTSKEYLSEEYVPEGRDEAVSQTERELLVVTSFYPIYIIAQNLTEGIPGVIVQNLTGNQTGCLHDYQLTTRDMRLLEQAELFLINGGGMETFLEQVAANLPGLVIVHSEEGVERLTEGAHTHTHELVDTDIEEVHTLEEEHEHGEGNAHIWMDPERYQAQIRNLADGLIRQDPKHQEAYEENRDRYLEQVAKVQKEYQEAFFDQTSEPVIIFHEAFAYLAEVAPFEVIEAVELEGEERALSPGELTSLIEECRLHQIPYLLIEETEGKQETIVDVIAEESGAEIIALDPLTSGDGALDSWLAGMRKNLEILLGSWNGSIP